MNNIEIQREWFQRLINQAEPNLFGSHLPWLKKLRDNAEREIYRLPVIQRNEKEWRYSHTEKLFKQKFHPVVSTKIEYSDPEFQANTTLSQSGIKLVFVNGQFSESLSNCENLPDDVIVTAMHDILKTHPDLGNYWFTKTATHREHLFTVLNTALMNYGVFIYIGKKIKLDRPIEILYLNSISEKYSSVEYKKFMGEMANLRNIIVLDDESSANIIERYSGQDELYYFNNNLTDVILGDSANLKHTCVQDESSAAYYMSYYYLSQHKESMYQGLFLSIGGSWSRTEINVDFKEVGAQCHLKGLNTAGNHQLTDIHIDVIHHVPSCTSRERFKSLLFGNGHAVFDGHVMVDKLAQFSDAFMTNDNLMLSRNAEVDTKPQLEIYADDVNCKHGTTVGHLDDEQIFYMNSRGIDARVAKKMLCLGFASEIIDSIEELALRNYVSDKLNSNLNVAVSATD